MSDLKPKLRGDLKITRQVQRDGVFYVIKDPQSQEYYRFPEREYQIIALFDGSGTFAQLTEKFNSQSKDFEIDKAGVQECYSSLDKIHFIEKPLAEQNLFLLERMRSQRKSKLLGVKGNIMYCRFSLFDPDAMLNRVYPMVRWMFTRTFFIFALLLMITAVILVIKEQKAFLEGMASITAFSDKTPLALAGLWLTVVGVIMMHELGHAFMCKHFGGEVHEIGVLLMFFTPCFYANVNDAWTFEKKGPKLWVTFAGGIVEFIIGSFAAVLWYFLNPATAASAVCYQIMTVCALSTVMFNFNPLMKLDGYYAFSDFVGVPNLKAESGKYVAYVLQKYLFRMKTTLDVSEVPPREKRILFFYGAASTVYMIGIMSGLVFMLQNLLVNALAAAGMVVSLFLAWKLLKGYVMKLKGFVVRLYEEKLPLIKAHPVAFSLLLATVLGIGLFVFVTTSLTIKKDCVLTPSVTAKLYAGVPGFLTQTIAQSGARIRAGDLIGILNDADLEERAASLIIKKETGKLNMAQALLVNDLQRRERAARTGSEIDAELQTLRQEMAACSVAAPLSGVVLSTQTTKGYRPYFNKGSELCEIAGVDSFLITLNLLESEIGDVKAGDRASVRLYALPLKSMAGRVIDKSPVTRGYAETAQNRGPKKKRGVENEFVVRVVVPNSRSMDLLPGMTGRIIINAGSISGLKLLCRTISKGLRTDLFF